MKKLLVAGLCGLLSTPIFAETTYDIYGELGVGGEIKVEGDKKGRYRDGTYFEIGLKVDNGPWFGLAYFEANTIPGGSDGKTWQFGHGIKGVEGGFNRLYVGYRFESNLELTAGRMDSALDNHSSWGDYTVEYAATPTDIGDVNVGIKLRQLKGPFRYGLSVAPKSNHDSSNSIINLGKYDEYADKFKKPAHVDGYVDFDVARFKFFAGAELTDGRGALYVLGAQYFDTIAVRAWHDTEKGDWDKNTDIGSEDGFFINGKIEPMKGLFFTAGYNYRNHAVKGKNKYANAGVWYAYGENNKYATAMDFHIPNHGDSQFMLKQFFYF